jgi:hypothetical protein
VFKKSTRPEKLRVNYNRKEFINMKNGKRMVFIPKRG